MWGLYAPSPPTTGPAGTDKLGHLLGFGAPAAVAWWLGGRWWVGLMVLHALVSEEVQQRISPERMMDGRDTLANLETGHYLLTIGSRREIHVEHVRSALERRLTNTDEAMVDAAELAGQL